MRNTFKIAISLPKEDFYKLEQIRKKLGFGRSTIIDKAIRFWLCYREKEELINCYRQGYREQPENIQEIEAMEKTSADAFSEEDLR